MGFQEQATVNLSNVLPSGYLLDSVRHGRVAFWYQPNPGGSPKFGFIAAWESTSDAARLATKVSTMTSRLAGRSLAPTA